MATKKSAGVNLDQAPEGMTHLRIRNVSSSIVVLAGMAPAQNDLVLLSQEETVKPYAEWGKNPHFRAMLNKGGVFEAEWTDAYTLPRHLPTAEEAPENIRPDAPYDRQYVNHICTTAPDDQVLEMVTVKVMSPNAEDVDTKFMKGRMYRILQSVKWLEPQLKNRPAIKKAVEGRLHEIRAM